MSESRADSDSLPLSMLFTLCYLLGFLSHALLAPTGFDYDRLTILFLMIFCLLFLYRDQDKLKALLKFDRFMDREVSGDE